VTLREGFEIASEIGREREFDDGAGIVLLWRARPVGGEFKERGEAGQCVEPEVGLKLSKITGQPAALPGGIVGILDGEGRQGIGQAVESGAVESAEFVDQDAERPAVGDDVVHGQKQHVVVGSETEKPAADQGTVLEVERPGGFADGQLLPGGMWIGLETEVMLGEGKAGVRRADQLTGMAVEQREGGAERFVPGEDPVESLPESGAVERADEAETAGDVIGETGVIKLREEPETLLSEGELERLPPIDRDDRRVRRGVTPDSRRLSQH
jgi:hypothetical protein